MRVKIGVSITMLVLLLLTAGCDSFSLLDRFYHADELPAPEDFTVNPDTGNPNSIELTWTYPVSGIDGFWIMCSENGGNFELIATEADLGSDARVYDNTELNGGTLYTYRMYAVLNEQLSLPTPELSSHSQP